MGSDPGAGGAAPAKRSESGPEHARGSDPAMRERLALHTWTLDSSPLPDVAPDRAGRRVAGHRAPADRLRASRRDGPARRGGAGPGARERPRRGVRRRPAGLDVRRRRGAGAAPRGDDRVLPVGAGPRRLDRDEPRRHGRRATSRGRPPPSARSGTSAPRTGSGSRSRRRRRPPSSTRSSGSGRCSRGRAIPRAASWSTPTTSTAAAAGSAPWRSSLPAEIAYVQFSDVPASGLQPGQTLDRLPPGRGIVPFREFFRSSRDSGYAGYCSYEAPNPAAWARDPLTVAREALAATHAVLP